MTRYHLNIFNDHGEAPDDEGCDLFSIDVARQRAIEGIRSLLSAEAMNGLLSLNGRIDITTTDGTTVLSVPFSEALAIKPDQSAGG